MGGKSLQLESKGMYKNLFCSSDKEMFFTIYVFFSSEYFYNTIGNCKTVEKTLM